MELWRQKVGLFRRWLELCYMQKKILVKFWVENVNTACYIHNRITLRPGTNNTTYEIWRVRKPNVQYFYIFGSICYILVDREQRQKFDVKGDEGIFLEYSRNNKALRVYNKRTQVIMESINIKVIDQDQIPEEEEEPSVTPLFIDSPADQTTEEDNTVTPTGIDSSIEPAARIQKTHPVGNIIGEMDAKMTTRRKDRVDCRKMAGNKARLVAQGYTQVERIDFVETFAHVARLEAIRLLIALACLLKFKLYQMDVKIAFLNGIVQDEVYVEQSKGFEDATRQYDVYKLKKALYGLKQAPRA
ncbi:hypothetical protein LIER_36173 [Lithospermum erythrorhizon]|uniref:Reverse transcriptase Ty1/copia-type domain-containing protein n=1 Tax=Lithospermum erythrorhizon TaxID=34254 RepID=A0AAV3P3B9_LITER